MKLLLLPILLIIVIVGFAFQVLIIEPYEKIK
jgi:hypothetical protein